jgi:hypothetical protein
MNYPRTKWLEAGTILLGIASLWPWILGYREFWYRGVLVGVLILLAALAVVRVRRFRRAVEEQLRQASTDRSGESK